MALMGDLRDLSLADLLYIFNLRGMTGRLSLQSEQDDGVLHFERGKLTYVTSSRFAQQLGQLLVRMRRITQEQLGVALAMQATTHVGQQLGEILVSQGWLADQELTGYLIHQAEDVLFRIMAWPTGTFSFTSAVSEPRGVPLRDFNVQQLILEATRRADEWAAIRERLPNLDCRVVLRADPSTVSDSGRLRLKARIVIASLLEGATTLREIGASTGLDDAEVMHIVYDLLGEGVVAVVATQPIGAGPGSQPLAGDGAARRGLLAPHRGVAGSAPLPAGRT